MTKWIGVAVGAVAGLVVAGAKSYARAARRTTNERLLRQAFGGMAKPIGAAGSWVFDFGSARRIDLIDHLNTMNQGCARCGATGKNLQGRPAFCQPCLNVLTAVFWAKEQMSAYGLPVDQFDDAQAEALFERMATDHPSHLPRCAWARVFNQLVVDFRVGRLHG